MISKFLDPRFHLVASLIDDPDETPEMRATARRQAEVVARESGFAFDNAMKLLVRPTAPDDDSEPVIDQHDDPANEHTPSVQFDDAQPNDQEGGQIADALMADPSRSDRDIARECGASPTTVGKQRGALGLAKAVRSVVRRGKPYDMAIGDRS